MTARRTALGLCWMLVATGCGQAASSVDAGSGGVDAIAIDAAVVDARGDAAGDAADALVDAAPVIDATPVSIDGAPAPDAFVGCGDGVVGPDESCDLAIGSGPGSCPTSCDDGEVCTGDVLVAAGTCDAVCEHPVIMEPADDGCCPDDANANTDPDCDPVCPNGVVEEGETCDFGDDQPGDGCDASCQIEHTAFRIDELLVREPHAYYDVFGCRDVTNSVLGLGFNVFLNDEIRSDENGDGSLDASYLMVFSPLDHDGTDQSGTLYLNADCSAPMSSTTCAPGGATSYAITATNVTSGTCLAPLADTTRPYSPAVPQPAAVCTRTNTLDAVSLVALGMAIPFSDVQIAAEYDGDPTTGFVKGQFRGFLSLADASTITIPADVSVVGGQILATVLRGGPNNCENSSQVASTVNSGSDMDIGPGGVLGWYFYMEFTAPIVGWTP